LSRENGGLQRDRKKIFMDTLQGLTEKKRCSTEPTLEMKTAVGGGPEYKLLLDNGRTVSGEGLTISSNVRGERGPA